MSAFNSGLALGGVIGALVSGAICVLSSRYLGWFNKQVKSIETKVGSLPK